MLNEKIIKTLKFKKFSWKVPKWNDSITGNAKFEKTMEKEPKLKAGDVLHMKDDKYILVGHVNRNMGVCDDCVNYEISDIKEIATLPGFEEEKTT
jgi:phage terminase large subunit-like protein